MDIAHSYIEKGSGEYLILLHGNGEDSSYFENQLEAFSKYFKVIALDTRGHGNTPRGEGEFSLHSRFVQDETACTPELCDSQYTLILKNHLGAQPGRRLAAPR